MIKGLIFVAFLIFNYPLKSFAQFTLTIEIHELRSSNGQILLQVYDETQNSVRGETGIIENNKSLIVINDLKKAKYAFRYFHDENDNNELETNWMGIPTEGFGFSNNAKGTFGPPSFKKWLFDLSGNMKMTCSPIY